MSSKPITFAKFLLLSMAMNFNIYAQEGVNDNNSEISPKETVKEASRDYSRLGIFISKGKIKNEVFQDLNDLVSKVAEISDEHYITYQLAAENNNEENSTTKIYLYVGSEELNVIDVGSEKSLERLLKKAFRDYIRAQTDYYLNLQTNNKMDFEAIAAGLSKESGPQAVVYIPNKKRANYDRGGNEKFFNERYKDISFIFVYTDEEEYVSFFKRDKKEIEISLFENGSKSLGPGPCDDFCRYCENNGYVKYKAEQNNPEESHIQTLIKN